MRIAPLRKSLTYPVQIPAALTPVLTVLTLVAPGCPAERFAAAMSRLRVPSGTAWIIYAHESLQGVVSAWRLGHGAIVPTVHTHAVEAAYTTPHAKAAATAQLYAEALAFVGAARVLVVEHDVLPHGRFVDRWMAKLGTHADIAAIGAPVAERDGPNAGQPMAWHWVSRDPWRLERARRARLAGPIGAVSLSCTMLRTSALRGLRLRPQAGPQANLGTDIALMADLATGGWSVLCDWAVRCEHAAHVVTPTPAPAVPVRVAPVRVVVLCHDPYLQYLDECLHSLSRQTVRPETVVLSFNGEGEAAARDAMERHGFGGEAAIVWAVTPDPCAKRNHAASLGTEPYLLFADSDNHLAPDYIERMLATLDSDPRLGIAYPRIMRFGGPEGAHELPGRRAEFDRAALCEGNHIDTCSMVRREAFDAVGGFQPGLPRLQDWHFVLRITGLGWGAQEADTFLHYREHAGSISAQRAETARTDAATAGSDARSLAIVTCFAGRHRALDRYLNWLRNQEWPHRQAPVSYTHLTLPTNREV